MSSDITYLKQVQTTLENLVYTGITTLSQSTCQRLAVLINDCSAKGFYRLAATLRTINSQLTIFLEKNKKIDQQLYAFLVNQAWLLTYGLITAIEKNDLEKLEQYSSQSKKVVFREIHVVPMGIEQIVVAQQRINYKFHFLVMKCPEFTGLRGKVITWTKIFDIKNQAEQQHYEFFLATKDKSTNVPLFKFLKFKLMILRSWKLSLNNLSIRSTSNSKVEFKTLMSQNIVNLPYFSIHTLQEELQSQIVSPLDHEYTFRKTIGFRNIIISSQQETKQTFHCSFEYANLSIIIELRKNISHTSIIKKLKHIIAKKQNIPYLYGIIRIRGGKFTFIPISYLEIESKDKTKNNDSSSKSSKKSVITNKQNTKSISRTVLDSKNSIKQKKIKLMSLQIDKHEIKPQSKNKVALSGQKKNLELLGDLLGKKK